jgi:hypothetical protein
MVTKFRCILSGLLLGVLITYSTGQTANEIPRDTPISAPRWTEIVGVKASQSNGYLILAIETADTIPRAVQDSSIFQFLLDTDSDSTTGFRHGSIGVDHIIQFEHNNWDGSPWFAMFLDGHLDKTYWPGDRHRMFDWSLAANTLTVRFSLKALEWSSINLKACIFYREKFTDIFPDIGHITLEVNTESLNGLKVASTQRTVFIYPTEFDSVLIQNQIPLVLDTAYEFEQELTGIIPVGGDTLRFVFHPLYGGAAIEGDPIYIGPAMWGKKPLWFVYFHEMGHNFCNASERFAQLYPLQFSVPPGPLPTNILFYEAFASLPAMYVYEQIKQNPSIPGVDSTVITIIVEDWNIVRERFTNAWNAYKNDPGNISLNPDIIDGLFLELVGEYSWGMFKEFYRLMRPADQPLPIFNTQLSNDSPDLQKTRATLTAAALSAAAKDDLSKRFKEWGFPIDNELFDSAMSTLVIQLNSPDDIYN